MYQVKCAHCGIEMELPFEPKHSKVCVHCEKPRRPRYSKSREVKDHFYMSHCWDNGIKVLEGN